jgi:tetratricopeptide (TPR) repeat protein
MATPEHRPRRKLSRKELKAPDEFLTLTARALGFAGRHLRTIALVLGVVIAGIVVASAAWLYVRGLEREALVGVAQIGARLRAAGAQELPADLLAQLQRIAGQWGAGAARGYAWLYLGHAHYRRGDYAAAAAAYRQAQARATSTQVLWSLATLGLGYASEAAGDAPTAQQIYRSLIDAKQAGVRLEAYLGQGRLAERTDDLEAAIAAYTAVVEQFPAYAQAFGIGDKLEALKARRS